MVIIRVAEIKAAMNAHLLMSGAGIARARVCVLALIIWALQRSCARVQKAPNSFRKTQ